MVKVEPPHSRSVFAAAPSCVAERLQTLVFAFTCVLETMSTRRVTFSVPLFFTVMESTFLSLAMAVMSALMFL